MRAKLGPLVPAFYLIKERDGLIKKVFEQILLMPPKSITGILLLALLLLLSCTSFLYRISGTFLLYRKSKTRYFGYAKEWVLFDLQVLFLALVCATAGVITPQWTMWIFLFMSAKWLICGILYIRLNQSVGVYQYMVEKLSDFFAWVDRIRQKAQQTEETRIKLQRVFYVLVVLFFGGVLISLFWGIDMDSIVDHTSVFLVLFLVVYFILFSSDSWFSCRKLLGFYFGSVLFVAAVGFIAIIEQGFSSFFAYFWVLLVFVIMWTVQGLFADDDVTKMTLHIVNTVITLFTLLLNILFVAIKLSEPKNGTIVDQALELINMTLLPSVSAGYIAGLMKEAQIYWRKHKM